MPVPLHELTADQVDDSARRASLLCRLPRTFLQAAGAAGGRDASRRAILSILVTHELARAAIWFARDAQGELAVSLQVPSELSARQAELFARTAHAAAVRACRQGETQSVDEPVCVLAAPVFRRGQSPEAIALWLDETDWQGVREAAVLAATHATLAELIDDVAAVNQTVRATAAMLEILERVEAAADLATACGELADQLQRYFDAAEEPDADSPPRSRPVTRAAVAICRGGRARLRSVSRVESFDRHSEMAYATEAAIDEALLRGSVTLFPQSALDQRHALRAHQRLASLTESRHVVSVPLIGAKNRPEGGLLLLGDNAALAAPENLRFLETLSSPVAQALELLTAARRVGPWQSLTRGLRRRATLWIGGLLAVVIAVLLVPLPYRVKCDCELQPVTWDPLESTCRHASLSIL